MRRRSGMPASVNWAARVSHSATVIGPVVVRLDDAPCPVGVAVAVGVPTAVGVGALAIPEAADVGGRGVAMMFTASGGCFQQGGRTDHPKELGLYAQDMYAVFGVGKMREGVRVANNGRVVD